MIRVMIVEDEILPRMGMRTIIDWKAHGYEIIAECENGQIAFKEALRLRPDIIITDVRMPVMGGITLMKQAIDVKLDARFIFLSAYDDFEIVRDAIRLGADDYLLKLELDEKSLLKSLSRVSKKIMQKQINEKETITEAAFLDATLWKNFVLHGKESKELTARWGSIRVEFPAIVCIFGRMISEDSRFDVSMLGKIEKGFDTLEGPKRLTNVFASGRQFYAVSFCNGEDNVSIYRYLDVACNHIYSWAENQCKVSYSDIFTDFSQIPERFMELRSYLEEKSVERLESFTEEKLILLQDAFRAHKFDVVIQCLEEIRKSVVEAKTYDRQVCYRICNTVIYQVKRFCVQNEILETIFFENENPYKILESLWFSQQFSEWIMNLSERIQVSFIQNASWDGNAINVAEQYIKENYAEDLTLESLAKMVNLSPGYFGKLFKRQTGVSFVTYLHKTRIENANRLLTESKYKIYEIAEMCGYTSAEYFSKNYKKYMGHSPKRQNFTDK